MLLAKHVQSMLEVDDDVVIAHGYSYDRVTTYDIWFHNGKLYRYGDTSGPNGDRKGVPPSVLLSSEEFNPGYFTNDIKRWYDSGINPNLVELFRTFGNPLATTPGGRYPSYPPVYLG